MCFLPCASRQGRPFWPPAGDHKGRPYAERSGRALRFALQYVVLTKPTDCHTVEMVICMGRKFQLPSIPETTPKNIRFPNEIIQQVDEVIQGTNVTFSRFVIEATRVALENMKEDGEDGE